MAYPRPPRIAKPTPQRAAPITPAWAAARPAPTASSRLRTSYRDMAAVEAGATFAMWIFFDIDKGAKDEMKIENWLLVRLEAETPL